MLTFARNRTMAITEGTLVAIILAIVFGVLGINVARSRAATSWTSPEGTVINVDSAAPWTTDRVYQMLKDDGLDSVVGPTLTVNVQDLYASQTTTSVSQVGGSYQNFRATIWLDGRTGSTFAALPEYAAGHEFGHAWTLYHLYMDQGNDWTAYLSYRGLAGDARLETSYAWTKREMIAEDYRLTLGSALAKSEKPTQMNLDIPAPSSFPDFATWFVNTWAKGHVAPPSDPTATTPSSTPAPTTQAPTPTPAATPAPTSTPDPTATPAAPPSSTPTSTPTPAPNATPTTTPSATPASTTSTLSITNLTASPQAFKRSTNISYTLSTQASIDAIVVDIKGTAIRTLFSGNVGGGTRSVTWDRTDDTGRRVANGTYQIVLRASDAVGDAAGADLTVTAK